MAGGQWGKPLQTQAFTFNEAHIALSISTLSLSISPTFPPLSSQALLVKGGHEIGTTL
jgi:hypothetical protein